MNIITTKMLNFFEVQVHIEISVNLSLLDNQKTESLRTFYMIQAD